MLRKPRALAAYESDSYTLSKSIDLALLQGARILAKTSHSWMDAQKTLSFLQE